MPPSLTRRRGRQVLLEHWFPAFVLTVVTEAAVVVPLLAAQRSPLQRIALMLGANLLTHPIVYSVMALATAQDHVLRRLVLAEGSAVVAEAIFYTLAVRPLPAATALGVSLMANGLWLVGGAVATALVS